MIRVRFHGGELFFYGLRCVLSHVRSYDKPVALVEGKVVPDPGGEDEQLVTEADQVVDVYEQPDPPGGPAAEVEVLWQVCDCLASADSGE